MVGTSREPTLRFADGGWAQAVGNHPALDLVNTVAWRLDPARRVDRIADGEALVRWAHFVGVLDDPTADQLVRDPDSGDRAAAQVRRLREELHRVVQPLAVGAEPRADDVAALHLRLVAVLSRAKVVSPMPLEWSTAVHAVDDLPDVLGVHAWRLLEREDPLRIRQCRDDSCGWLFLDRTKNGSRVWCSSADCGNRTRARRHYERHGPGSR